MGRPPGGGATSTGRPMGDASVCSTVSSVTEVAASAVAELEAAVAREMEPALPFLTDELVGHFVDKIPELAIEDEDIRELLVASAHSNLATAVDIFAHGIPVDQVEVPAAAAHYVRRMAQRDVPVESLLRAYRLGGALFLQWWLHAVGQHNPASDVLLAATKHTASVETAYIDQISETLVEIYDDERKLWAQRAAATRAVQVAHRAARRGPGRHHRRGTDRLPDARHPPRRGGLVGGAGQRPGGRGHRAAARRDHRPAAARGARRRPHPVGVDLRAEGRRGRRGRAGHRAAPAGFLGPARAGHAGDRPGRLPRFAPRGARRAAGVNHPGRRQPRGDGVRRRGDVGVPGQGPAGGAALGGRRASALSRWTTSRWPSCAAPCCCSCRPARA